MRKILEDRRMGLESNYLAVGPGPHCHQRSDLADVGTGVNDCIARRDQASDALAHRQFIHTESPDRRANLLNRMYAKGCTPGKQYSSLSGCEERNSNASRRTIGGPKDILRTPERCRDSH